MTKVTTNNIPLDESNVSEAAIEKVSDKFKEKIFFNFF